MATAFRAYPVEAGRRVIDPVRGLPSTCKFVPVLAEVVDALKEQARYVEAIYGEGKPEKGRSERRMVPERLPRKPFMPYPKLWDALEGEPDLLKVLKAMTFDEMTATSKLMAMEGIDAAKAKLRRIAAMPDRQKASAA